MFRQLKLYYVIVILPFALLLTGSAIFFQAIKSTIIRNPHPQINYTIFAIVLIGGTLIVVSAHKLVREARALTEFSQAIRAKFSLAALQDLANTYSGDIACALQMVAATGGRTISHQEQSAIEHELTKARERLVRRNALPQYLTGLLVGMGLLGTFIGLLSTLNDISTLISSFADLDMNNASPILVFRTMIERMKAPMQSMGIAFSASMFGLLGSIILGLMMLGIRRLQGDIISLLGSEVARHIENALSQESTTAVSQSVAGSGNAAVYFGEESKILFRIEERLAESVRLQQRILSSEIDDFQKQRADMLRVLIEQTEATNNFRSDLQQLGHQFASVLTILEKGNTEVGSQISEITVQLAAAAKEMQKLGAEQADEQRKLGAHIAELTVHLAAAAKESQTNSVRYVEEQKKLRDTLDAYKIEEWLAQAAHLHQRALTAEIDDFQKQRAEMVRALTEQTVASNNFHSELQRLGRQFGEVLSVLEKGNGELSDQLSELLVHMNADAKESHKLLAMQVNEQRVLRETLDRREISCKLPMD